MTIYRGGVSPESGSIAKTAASNVTIVDSGSNYAATNVEDALTEEADARQVHEALTGTSVHGLGTLSTQAANNVAITGGSVSGITDLAVVDGGTGASTASDARTNLGLGTAATANVTTAAYDTTSGRVWRVDDLVVTSTTWTPRIDGNTTAGSGTYTEQTGKYTRIANVYICQCTLIWTAHTGTGAIRIAGLPFTAAATNSFTIFYSNLNVGSGKEISGILFAGQSYGVLYASDPAGGAASALNMDTSGEIRCTIVGHA